MSATPSRRSSISAARVAPGQRLEDDGRPRRGDDLVAAHQVRVRERREQRALGEHALAHVLLVQPVRAHHLDHRAAVALEAGHVVGVDPAAAGQQRLDPVAGEHLVADGYDGGLDRRRHHRPAPPAPAGCRRRRPRA